MNLTDKFSYPTNSTDIIKFKKEISYIIIDNYCDIKKYFDDDNLIKITNFASISEIYNTPGGV